MNTIEDNLNQRISARIRIERESRGWSLNDLAERAGASRAMIHKIERGESSPTASMLGRLSGAFGISMSTLIARAEMQEGKLLRFASQPVWHDPQSHYLRRHVSPRSDLPIDLVQIELPPGSDVPMPASSYALARQLIWLQQGELVFMEGNTRHEMQTGTVWSSARRTTAALSMSPQRPASIWWCALINRHPALNVKAHCA
jgi:transcriptional regulator with XRE-family HTH domain